MGTAPSAVIPDRTALKAPRPPRSYRRLDGRPEDTTGISRQLPITGTSLHAGARPAESALTYALQPYPELRGPGQR